MSGDCNVSRHLTVLSKKFPDRVALVQADSLNADAEPDTLTYSELDAMTARLVCEFRKNQVSDGAKVLMMQTPGFHFVASVFALFRIGAVPILIDPGMGLKNMLGCVRKTSPDFLFGRSFAQWLSLLFPGTFRTVRRRFSCDSFLPPGVRHLDAKHGNCDFRSEIKAPEETAAIVFTTGSTGPPKGVRYTHGIYEKQLEVIAEAYGAGPHETDMSAFPLFALFSVLLGMKSVIPDFNPSRPAKADPERVLRIIEKHRVSFSFASPALWRNLAEHCISKNIVLKSLKKALMAGAPVPASLHRDMAKMMPEGAMTIVPYGATECLPIANFTGAEMLAETAHLTENGAGYCVGYPVKAANIALMPPYDYALPEWDEKLAVHQGEIGEIVVSGPLVTPEYYMEPEHNRLSKFKGRDGELWHRIGDIGRFDEKGRLWFLGRKAHRVFTKDGILYPVSCESIFNRDPKVFRTALVGVGARNEQIPILVVEAKKGMMPWSRKEKESFAADLARLGKTRAETSGISHFLFLSPFPVDIRHNAKIFREKLAIWAEKNFSSAIKIQ